MSLNKSPTKRLEPPSEAGELEPPPLKGGGGGGFGGVGRKKRGKSPVS